MVLKVGRVGTQCPDAVPRRDPSGTAVLPRKGRLGGGGLRGRPLGRQNGRTQSRLQVVSGLVELTLCEFFFFRWNWRSSSFAPR